MTQRSVAQLAKRKADLLEELGELNAEIAERAGQIDPKPVAKAPVKAAPAKSPAKH
ncbi:hypothetical protein SAMN04488583_6381 [Mycobacterium sp. 88mf]|nr:hypothetical protein SAMN04488583_6381 [Mycobacterium sp. 88mf]SFG61657.1 hypothetical protein SAMN04488582_11081 [Mycobacterium sp. 455mf]